MFGYERMVALSITLLICRNLTRKKLVIEKLAQ